MASAPGVDGMVDIRSYAILQDVNFNDNECAQGADVAAVRGPFYRGFTHELTAHTGVLTPADPFIRRAPQGTTRPIPVTTRLPQHSAPFFALAGEAGFDPPPQYDTPRSWLSCFCSVIVNFLIFGTVFSYAILQEQIRLTHSLSAFQSILVGGSSFAIFALARPHINFGIWISISLLFQVGPLATRLIMCLGFRATAIFGMLLLFLGLLIEGFLSNVIIFYASRLIFIPVGGGLAHTASYHVSSFFEKQLKMAVLLLSISSVLGILVFSCFASILQSIVSYKAIQLLFAIIVLLLMAVTQGFPFRLKKRLNTHFHQAREVKTCIEKKIKKEVLDRAGKTVTEYNPDATTELKSCLCVCVCECGSTWNHGFFLWAVITMVATLTFLVPYLFLSLFLLPLPGLRVTDTPLKLIAVFCVSTLLVRAGLIVDNNSTFLFNRAVFQVAIGGCGVLQIMFYLVSSYGWLLVWVMCMGFCQGLLTVTIPRVTLQTVARQWLKPAWVVIVILDAIGSFIGPVFLMMLRFTMFQTQFQLPTLIIGILQLAGMIFAFFIPNDENNYKPQVPPTETRTPPPPSQLRPIAPKAVQPKWKQAPVRSSYRKKPSPPAQAPVRSSYRKKPSPPAQAPVRSSYRKKPSPPAQAPVPSSDHQNPAQLQQTHVPSQKPKSAPPKYSPKKSASNYDSFEYDYKSGTYRKYVPQ